MYVDDRYRRAAAAGGVGIWDWNLVTNEVYVDPVLQQILGYEEGEIGNHMDDWRGLVHPGRSVRRRRGQHPADRRRRLADR